MKLSPIERLQLANQFKILSYLDVDTKEHYETMLKIVERGYEKNYYSLCDHISDREFPKDRSNYVLDVLDMYLKIQDSLSHLETGGRINEDDVKFQGFDGNTEADLLEYANFCLEDLHLYENLKRTGDNSHLPTSHLYQRMLKRFAKAAEKGPLTTDDLLYILDKKN